VSGSIVYERKRKGKRKETRLDLVNTLFLGTAPLSPESLVSPTRRTRSARSSRILLNRVLTQRLAETEKEEKPMKAHLLTIRGRTRTRNFTGVDAEEHTLFAARSARTFLDCGYTMCHGAASAKQRLERKRRNL
jgi:hypothetical protein